MNEKQKMLISNKRHDDGIIFCWLGNAGWLLRAKEGLFAFDLDLSGAVERLTPSPISAEDLAPYLDAVMYTHEHGDHFHRETASILAAKSNCTFVFPVSCRSVADDLGIPDSRKECARPGAAFSLLGASILPVKALHGHLRGSIYNEANFDDCGYHVKLGGVSLFQPGDSVLLYEHAMLPPTDILFVSPTEHNMQVEKSAVFIEWVKPRMTYAQHFGTYVQTPENTFWTRGCQEELSRALNDPCGYCIPTIGEVYEYIVMPPQNAKGNGCTVPSMRAATLI